MNAWTQEEDELLRKFYSQTESFKKWKRISNKFLSLGIKKSVYQCRQRYINKLDPFIKTDKWNLQQIRYLFYLYNTHGSKWQKIESFMPQRTQTQLKNKFFSFLRSFLLRTSQSEKLGMIVLKNRITSKLIKKLYQGTQEFFNFKGKIFNYLQSMNYQINSEKIIYLIKENKIQIQEMFLFFEESINIINLDRNKNDSVSNQSQMEFQKVKQLKKKLQQEQNYLQNSQCNQKQKQSEKLQDQNHKFENIKGQTQIPSNYSRKVFILQKENQLFLQLQQNRKFYQLQDTTIWITANGQLIRPFPNYFLNFAWNSSFASPYLYFQS